MSYLTRDRAESGSISFLVFVGIVSGFISALVKSGVEDLLPPRMPDAIPPPIGLLELFGFDGAGMTYQFMGQTINWGGNGVHILFSIVIAVVYCVATKYNKTFGVLNGIPFGLVMGLGSHFVLPLVGIGPAPWNIPLEGYISEVVGSALWIWTIDAIRRRFVSEAPQHLRMR